MRVMSAPYYIAWNYNYACNFNCSHCYSRAPWYPEELSTEEYRRIADEIADIGVFRVALGGGEPLLREDVLEILSRLSRRGVETNLTTNGWRFEPDTASALVGAGLKRLYVSVDSSDGDQHDRFRRKPGSFVCATQAAAMAASADIEVFFSTVLTRENYHQIGDIAALAASLGAAGVEFKRFRPAGNGVAFEGAYTLSPMQSEALPDKFRAIQRSSTVELSLINGPEANIMSSESEGCACGVKSICIRPNGDVSPCAYSDIVIGNMKAACLKEIWVHSDFLAALRRSGGCQALQATAFPANPSAQTFATRREARARAEEKTA